jgi:hypothetical protein
MITDITQARREMFLMLQAAWESAVWNGDFVDATPVLLFDGRDVSPPPPDKPYSMIYMRPAFEGQATLADANGVRRWEGLGTLFVQCFGPLASGKGLEMAEYQSTIAALAYRGKSSENCIWFRNVRKNYVGSSGGWYQINVLVDYISDELR